MENVTFTVASDLEVLDRTTITPDAGGNFVLVTQMQTNRCAEQALKKPTKRFRH